MYTLRLLYVQSSSLSIVANLTVLVDCTARPPCPDDGIGRVAGVASLGKEIELTRKEAGRQQLL